MDYTEAQENKITAFCDADAELIDLLKDTIKYQYQKTISSGKTPNLDRIINQLLMPASPDPSDANGDRFMSVGIYEE